MGSYLDILKRKARNANRNAPHTVTDITQIKRQLEGFLYDNSKEPIVLYKPSDSYWILLTEDSLIFFSHNNVNEILYREIRCEEVYFHEYRNYVHHDKKILSDHIRIQRKTGGAPMIFPIEVLSVFSFSEPLNFILTQLNQ